MSWMKKAYSRLLIDNHITDLKPEFMSRFEPAEYVRMVKLSGVDSSMVYACCHNGNCYYPTKAGHMHTGLKGRDIFGETVSLLRKENIIPVAYYTVIYHNESAKNHPAWRCRDINGKEHNGRYWYSCPNSDEYLAYVKAQLSEISVYDVAGFFIDMTFWPMVCRCENCRAKYLAETGKELPLTIDWADPEWVIFQRSRERWMAEFAAKISEHVRSLNPDFSVTHQFSPVLHGWGMGQSSGIALASDYASGDFYGNKYQHRLGAKIFDAYSKFKPYEFMSSRCVNLHDHTSTKSEDELYLHAGTTLANGGAYFFIDAINTDGTLNEDVFRRIANIGKRLKPFKDFVQEKTPELSAVCGLYFSMSSCVNPELSGVKLADMHEAGNNNMSVRENILVTEVTGTAVVLNHMKVPYKILTDLSKDFSGLKTIIINNAAYMSEEEVSRIREFVKNGGTLIATGLTSLYKLNGESSGNFQLADVFGVDYSGKKAEQISYLKCGNELISCDMRAPLVKASSARVRGIVNRTDFPCSDAEAYASIHSNPPGYDSEYAGLTVNSYGKGCCIYLAQSILRKQQDSQQEFAKKLFGEFLPQPFKGSKNLPNSLELTVMKTEDASSLIISLVNYQEELPNIPLQNLKIRFELPEGFSFKSIRRVFDSSEVKFSREGALVSFEVLYLENIEMFELK